MIDTFIYFSLEYALIVHEHVINVSGGLQGVTPQNKGQLDSILCHVKNDEYYPNFIDKLTHIIYSIAKFHVFIDGNKRTAIALGAYFLELNGYEHVVSNYIKEMENYIVWTMERRISVDVLMKKLEYIVYEIDEPEEFKYKMIMLLQD